MLKVFTKCHASNALSLKLRFTAVGYATGTATNKVGSRDMSVNLICVIMSIARVLPDETLGDGLGELLRAGE